MVKQKAMRRIEKLREAIEQYRYAYHVKNKSLISEDALDSLKKELFDLEQKFPDLVTPDSPTQRVSGKPLDEFKKVRHASPMLSLEDAFSEDDVRAWFERVSGYLGERVAPEFYCELKIDGLAVELVYENGIFVEGSTRGDGITGEDVTQNLKTIDAIPLRLNQKPKIQKQNRLVVRGEVFLTKKEFARINRKLEKVGKKSYANPRNLAAGTIRQLDSKITASRKLDSFMYAIVTDLGQETHEEEHRTLRKLGFKTNSNAKLIKSLTDAFAFRDYWNKHRDRLPYEIDGTVVILNNNKIAARAGVVGKAPRAAVAFKFSARDATTIVRAIRVQVGRTGVLTPVADLDPVTVGGVTITHATLHNADEIKRLEMKVGDTVIVSRAGDVIPKIIKVLPELRTGAEKVFQMPKFCPVDESPVIKDGALHRCSNSRCGARQRKMMCHFISRAAFNIEGLGPQRIDQFIDAGLLSDAADIFTLKVGDIIALERFGKKSAQNIVEEIASKKTVSLSRFIFSLGILHVGEETANMLSKIISHGLSKISRPVDILHIFGSMYTEDLRQMDDIGPVVANSIHSWFRNARNKKLIENLDDVGVRITIAARASDKLKGLTFVLTGTLSSLSREEAKGRIRAHGGEVSETVSKKTNYLVAGFEPGSKFDRAKMLGVSVLNERAFRKLVG